MVYLSNEHKRSESFGEKKSSWAAKVVQEEPSKKKLWNQTQRTRRLSRSEVPILYVFVFQVQGIEVDLQQQQFLPQSIRECG